MAGDRWATFDCYGTLIDWDGGMRAALARAVGEERADAQLERYHDVEPALEADGSRTYRQVLADAMRELGASEDDADVLARSLPTWKPFPEATAVLSEARVRGWKLAILSNTDRDFIEASMERIGVPFELAIVASEIGSYKPGHRHWLAFFEQSGAAREQHVHVAQSHFHDIVPATELGLNSIWINRRRERRDPPPTRELLDLTGLPAPLVERARSLLEARGFREVRRFYRMQIDFDTPPAPPNPVDGISVAVFRPEDARVFHATMNEAFGDDWGFHPMSFDEWKSHRLEQPET